MVHLTKLGIRGRYTMLWECADMPPLPNRGSGGSEMRRRQLASTMANALSSLAPQVLALVLLSPADFGHFSFTYLAYALGISLSLSIVAEPWHLRSLAGTQSSWSDFAAVSAILATTLGLLAWLAAALIDSPALLGPVVAIAIAIGIFRASARYYLVQQNRPGRASTFDLTFVGLLVISMPISLSLHTGALGGIYIGWATAGVASLFLLPPLRLADASPQTWLRRHARHIRRLLTDSILMDIGAIFTPAVIAPTLGAAAFGTYRAISNVSAPVRLILNPLRPTITEQRDAGAHSRARIFRLAFAGGLVLAVAASAVLLMIGTLGLQVGVLNSLIPFIPAVAMTLWANFIGHYCYIRARSRFSDRALISTRIAHTAVVSLLPLTGAFFYLLEGAIWGSAIASIVVAALWAWMDRNQLDPFAGSSQGQG